MIYCISRQLTGTWFLKHCQHAYKSCDSILKFVNMKKLLLLVTHYKILSTQREWAEAKRELQEQRDLVRNLSLEHDSSLKDARKQVDELNKELATAVRSVANAESRAAIAEVLQFF